MLLFKNHEIKRPFPLAKQESRDPLFGESIIVTQ